jgi:hypothetical protein
LEKAGLKVEFHSCKDVPPNDGAKWYFTVGSLILAAITLRKFINFSLYEVDYTELGIDTKPIRIPFEFKFKKTLQDAIEAVQARLGEA